MADKEKDLTQLVKKNKSLHSGHRSRLREKVDVDNEMRTFADHEMLEFQLSLVIPRRDTNKLAHELINHFGSLESVYEALPCELVRIKGMTTSAAYLIGTQNAIMRRVIKNSHVDNRTMKVDNLSDVVENLSSLFLNRRTEMFVIVLLDVKNRAIRTFSFDSVNPSGVFIAVEDIIYRALREGASNVIIAHNHPSGDVSPSSDDIVITKHMFKTMFGAGINLLEHSIFYQDRVFSFKNAGLIDMFKEEYYIEQNDVEKISQSLDSRRIYLSSLVEYMFDPEKLFQGDPSTIPREELARRYFNAHNGDPNNAPKVEETKPSKNSRIKYGFSDSAVSTGLGEITKVTIKSEEIEGKIKSKIEEYPDDF